MSSVHIPVTSRLAIARWLLVTITLVAAALALAVGYMLDF